MLAEELAVVTRDMREILGNPSCSTVARTGVMHVRELFRELHSPRCALLRRDYPEQGATYAAQVQTLIGELLGSLEVA